MMNSTRPRIEKAIVELATEIDDENVFRRELTSLLEPGTVRFERALAAWRELKRRLSGLLVRRLQYGVAVRLLEAPRALP